MTAPDDEHKEHEPPREPQRERESQWPESHGAKRSESSHPGPPDREERDARRLKGVSPELLKRAVEIGVEKAADAPETIKHLVSDLRLPKEVATYLLSQVEDTKNGALRVVAKETREFLEHTNVAHELQKMLTTLQFEINTTIRFRPADQKSGEETEDEEGETTQLPKPEVKMDVFARKKKKTKEG